MSRRKKLETGVQDNAEETPRTMVLSYIVVNLITKMLCIHLNLWRQKLLFEVADTDGIYHHTQKPVNGRKPSYGSIIMVMLYLSAISSYSF